MKGTGVPTAESEWTALRNVFDCWNEIYKNEEKG